ncbi:MAG TPA: PIG-L family deacetylase [Candidatus Binatia bacterium]|nr:PIG-L family deacetylase [Candidatus Binatia bacterium]
MPRSLRRLPLAVALPLALLAACGDAPPGDAPTSALVVVSPHPDDESILAAETIHRLAAEPRRLVRVVYVSGGDRATVPGDCNGIPEAEKTERIVALREDETRAAWDVMAPGRDVPIAFVRGPDMGLVASSRLVDGRREDVLTPAGQGALERAVAAASDVPATVRSAIVITASLYDAHPDHRTAYHAARRAAESLARDRGVAVRLWSWIVHDEIRQPDPPICCAGDVHWPAPGPRTDLAALVDTSERPRPPAPDLVEDVPSGSAIRSDALSRHVSQVVGWPPLCMPVYVPAFYDRWIEKIEEPFYEELF